PPRNQSLYPVSLPPPSLAADPANNVDMRTALIYDKRDRVVRRTSAEPMVYSFPEQFRVWRRFILIWLHDFE
ncbi:MAG: hypothetical protein O7C39_04995, partial [Bacteroidetes bacterium]|nr:hypothetical protein [Bacteroidota bacterium]